jgi:putative tryptophan/tyrosine transport system substrate-binding protein
MDRRRFIGWVGGGAIVFPLAASAKQPEKIARIGYLSPLSASQNNRYVDDAFVPALRDLGYIEGKNIHIEFRFADGDEDRLARLATELVALNVDVIVTHGIGDYATKRATTTIPIVMATAADVVAMGIVASLAHPGGNVTGLTSFLPELMAKRLELLKEVVPSMTRVGVLLRRNVPSTANILEVMRAAARELRVELQPIEVGGVDEFESAFSAWTDKKPDGLVMPDLFISDAAAIAALAAKHGLPSSGPTELPARGGLMGYGVEVGEMFRRSAAFVDKILKGAKPGDIPVEQATKFKLVLNLKTAKALGLTIPQTLVVAADEMIE